MSFISRAPGSQCSGDPGNFLFSRFAWSGGNITLADAPGDSSDMGLQIAAGTWVDGQMSFGNGGSNVLKSGASVENSGLSQGVVIDSAIFQAECKSNTSDGDCQIACEDVDAADTPSTVDGPNGWTGTTGVGTKPKEDFVATVPVNIEVRLPLQELVNRASWNEGRINFLIENTDETGTQVLILEGHANFPFKLITSYRQ